MAGGASAARARATAAAMLRTAYSAGAIGVFAGAHAAWLISAAAAATPAAPLPRATLLWCAYALALAAFHFLEFALTAAHQPDKVSPDSFLLNHSAAYTAATVAAALEFGLEAALAPGLKASSAAAAAAAAGAVLVLGGQALRSAAMATARSNFTHLIASTRAPGHVLVRHGVYGRLRHPAYAGWFWWSIGMQLLLANPLCALLYAAAAWRFFAERIPAEEATLVAFFGEEYVEYAAATALGIPGVHSPAAAMRPEEARARAEAYARRAAAAAAMAAAAAQDEAEEEGEEEGEREGRR